MIPLRRLNTDTHAVHADFAQHFAPFLGNMRISLPSKRTEIAAYQEVRLSVPGSEVYEGLNFILSATAA